MCFLSTIIPQLQINPALDRLSLLCDGILQQVCIFDVFDYCKNGRKHIAINLLAVVFTKNWNVKIIANCAKGSGRYYHGHVNRTKSEIPCATWFSNEPHEQSSPPKDIFPEMTNSANHCRNPGGTESSPWCYTTDPSVRWQYCDIPKCGKFQNN